jgi:hypothetical protein
VQAIPRNLRLGLSILGVSLVLALASLGIQRHGPDMGQVGEGCGPALDQPCYVALLSGGWPLAFVVDAPAVSNPNRLGPEDTLKPERFFADALFYGGLLTIAWRYGVMRRRLRPRRPPGTSGSR